MALDTIDGDQSEDGQVTVRESDEEGEGHADVLSHIRDEGPVELATLRDEVATGPTLAEALTDLDAGGFVDRVVEAGSPPRVAYSLGERGDRALRDWHLYRSGVVTCRRCGDRLPDARGCSYCGGTYCSNHRLPENHDCAGVG